MFLWKARVFQQECERLQPELAAFIAGFPKEDFLPYLEERFASLPKISVDYAILEKAKRVIALEASFDWDDVGTWTALPAHLPADAYGNTVRGTVAPVASSNNIAISNGRIIALCGVDNLVVVETADAVLVCHRDAVQRIKELQSLIPDALK
jgi:mannose-1-phosphate guanylyltransferase